MMSTRRELSNAQEVTELHTQVAQVLANRRRVKAAARPARPWIAPATQPGLFLVKSGTKAPGGRSAGERAHGRLELVTENHIRRSSWAPTLTAETEQPNVDRWLLTAMAAAGPVLWLGHELLVALKLL